MSSHKIDERRREAARQVRRWSVEQLHDRLADAGVTRAFIVSENGELTLSHPKLLAPVRCFFELSHDFAQHEGMFIGREDGIPTLFVACVHDTRRGLSQGGLRFRPYESAAELLTDGLRLAQGMTRKNALAGLWWGGGKGVIPRTRALETPAYLTEGTPERLELFRAYGRFVASLGGIYYTAEDVGTKTSDMNALLGQNRFTTCVGAELGGSGNPSPVTARGVFRAMQAGWRFLTDTDDLAGVKVSVQGVGNVGGPLVELLDDAGARVWVSDIDRGALADLAARRPRVEVVDGEALFDLDVDVFAPCAIGAQVNSRTIPRLRARLICGAANNILEEPDDAERLRKRGIVYVPDYVCNRMGITNCADEWQGYLQGDVELAAERVYPDTLRVLKHARGQMITSAAAADQLADVAASELHPLIGHRGRRIIDHLIASDWHGVRGRRPASAQAPAFEPGADEPASRARWERQGSFRGSGPILAAAPISAAGRPSLAALLSALLMDVRARAAEALGDERPRRALGSDPGGLMLQMAVERSLPFEREEIGRPRFAERCADVHRRHDEAVREQLHQLGVGFDPDAWIDPMSRDGQERTRRLFSALDEAGLVRRENRLTYYDPGAETVLISPDVIRTQVELEERFTVRFATTTGDEVETHTFFPELLGGAVAVAVRSGGPYGHLDRQPAKDPLRPDRLLPIFAVPELATDAKFLVPAHDRDDHQLTAARTIEVRLAIDPRGRFLIPGEPPLGREEARRLVLTRLGASASREEGRWQVDAFRARRSETLVNLGTSEQVFVHLEAAAGHLRRAIEDGAVTFSDPARRRRAERLLAELEPWCVSRQTWWGTLLPGGSEDVLSVWFSLAAWTLAAIGWPQRTEPEPIAEVFVDSELFERWVVPSLLVSLAVTGRPAFRHVHVHEPLHVLERVLEPRPGAAQTAPDEERFTMRTVRRPMRRSLGNAVEPATLIRRFGADALRLGYLLSLHGGTRLGATAAESHLRRGRHAVHRLHSKVSGLFHLTRERGDGEVPLLADDWLLTRAAQATAAARRAYARPDFPAAAELFTGAARDLARYAGIAAARVRGGERGRIRATLATAVAILAEGFTPVCPYLFDKLTAWTRPRAQLRSDPPLEWIGELVDTLAKGRRGAPVCVTSADDDVRQRLEAGREELARLARATLEVTAEPGPGDATEVGPCVVVRPAPLPPTLHTHPGEGGEDL